MAVAEFRRSKMAYGDENKVLEELGRLYKTLVPARKQYPVFATRYQTRDYMTDLNASPKRVAEVFRKAAALQGTE